MPQHNVLNAAIAPILILLKERDEAGTGDPGEPSSRHTLDCPAQQKRGKVHAQCCSNDGHPTFHNAKACQRSPH